MIRRVVFFNNFAFGDLHLSRGLVRATMRLLPGMDFGYVHHRSPEVLADIPGLPVLSEELPRGVDFRTTVDEVVGNTLYVNTWYCAGDDKFTKPYNYRCCFDVLHDLFEDVLLRRFGIQLAHQATTESLFPVIDYERFEIERATQFVQRETRPVVLVCNGDVTSGQAENFDLGGFVRDVADKRRDLVFVMTSRDWRQPTENVVYSNDVIGKSAGRCDLNEVSFLSSHSAAIIGRASGPFSFAMTQQNLFEREPTWLCFCRQDFGEPFWLSHKFSNYVKYTSSIPQYRVTTRKQVVDLVEAALWGIR